MATVRANTIVTAIAVNVTIAIANEKRIDCLQYLPVEGLSLGHLVAAPVPRDVIVHASVSPEERGTRPQQHR